MKKADEIRTNAVRKRAQERANAQAQAQMIGQQRLLFQVRAGDNGRLYGSVTSTDIAEKLSEAVGFEVDRRRIQLDSALRDLGIHQIEIRMIADVAATFAVALVREEESWADAESRQAKVAKSAESVEETAEA